MALNRVSLSTHFSSSLWPKNSKEHSVAIAACSVSNVFLKVAMCILLLSPRRCFPFWKNLIETDSGCKEEEGAKRKHGGGLRKLKSREKKVEEPDWDWQCGAKKKREWKGSSGKSSMKLEKTEKLKKCVKVKKNWRTWLRVTVRCKE